MPDEATVRENTPLRLFGTQKINGAGHLEVGGCDTVELARRFGTPLYVMDEAFIRERMRAYRRAFGERYPQVAIAYAGKAFLTLAMARMVDQEGLHLDVASAGELFTALKAECPPERIVMHGNNKSRAELEMALEHRVGRIVLDNLHELAMLEELARERGAAPDVMVRSNPGVDPHTHRLIRTGQEDSKFGLNIRDGSAMEAVRRCVASDALRFAGVHCHVGSQLMDASAHREAVDVMCAFLRDIREETGAEVEELNMGGGLGISYLESQNPVSIDDYAETIVSALREGIERYGIRPPVLGQEPGRSIVGQAGITLYEVGAVKRVSIPDEPGYRDYVTIDGGMSDNPRPQLYDAVYEALVADRAGEPRDWRVRIAGKHCETDILIQDTMIQQAGPGDILAVQATGAYNYAMASNYNRLPRPAVVLVCDGRADVIVRRESLDDVVRHDVIPARFWEVKKVGAESGGL